MTGDNLFTFVSMMFAMEDEGITIGSTLEEANDTYEGQFGEPGDDAKWATQEELDADLKKYQQLCKYYEQIEG